MRKSLLVSVALCSLALTAGATANTGGATATSENPFSTYLSARVAAGQHDLSEAARLYRTSLADSPDDPDLANRAFLYTAASGDVAASIDLAGKVIVHTPDDRVARMALAIGALKQGDYRDARKQLAQSGKGPFTMLTLLLIDGWAQQGLGDTDGALKSIDGMTAAGGTGAMTAYHKALIDDLAGRTTDTEAAYLDTLKQNSGGPRVSEAYGRFLERSGRTADAQAFYANLAGDDSMAPVAGAAQARIAAGTKPDRLVKDLQDGAAEGLFSVAASLNDATNADIAILYLRFALYLRPDFDLAKIILADRFEALKKYDDAIAVYRSIDVSSPYQPAAQIQVAIDQGRLGNNDQAVAMLKAITDAHATDISAWSSLGDAYRSASKDAEATAAYDHAIALLNTPERKDWQLFFARAVTEENIKHMPQAEADLKTALKLSPDQPQVLNYLGYTYVDENRNLPQAIVMLEKARQLSPYDGYIVDSVGWAYFRMARYKEAATTLQAAVLLVPGDSTINEHLGDAYWMAGRKLDARFQWNHALAFATDPKTKPAIEKKLASGIDAAQARAGK